MRITRILFGVSVALASGLMAIAQDAATSSIPQVLQITREYIKPYKSGMAHDKTESAFIAAMTRAKFPAYYIGLNSMSGKSRAIYLTQYPSYAEWEKDNKIVDKNPALGADLERASLADGDLLDQVDSVVLTYDADLSYHPHADVSHARYFEITVFHVRPGHAGEWNTISKTYRDLMDKANPSAHWATFDVAYGGEGGTYVSLIGYKSMAEIDEANKAWAKILEAAGGPGGWSDKFDKPFGEAVDSYRAELFSVNPKQSYVSEDWIKDDPSFWKPKATEISAAKPVTRPAAAAKPAGQ